MKEGKRQKQVGNLVQEEINVILQKLGLNMIDGALISVSEVKMTPDLLEARIYLSIYNAKDEEKVLDYLKEKHGQIKYELGKKLRFHLRRIPVLVFFRDDTMDYVYKLEEVFKKIQNDDSAPEA